jgi:ectoine hydroxylase
MKDKYSTRKESEGKFLPRVDPISYTDYYENYINDGYLFLPKFFSRYDIDKCLESSKNSKGLITKEVSSDTIRAVTGIHEEKPFKDIAGYSVLTSIVNDILGGPSYVHQSRINYKHGLTGSGWSWHSDFETWHSQDGMPSMRCLSAMIPLTENTECNGSLMVIPGSHKYFYSCKREKVFSAEENFADQKEGVPPTEAMRQFFYYCSNQTVMVKCSPGDLLLFDCNLMHVSTANLTPLPRTNLFIVYNSVDNKLVDPFSYDSPRPEEMGSRKITNIFS